MSPRRTSPRAPRGPRPSRDRLPTWWRRMVRRLDVGGYLAVRLEPHFRRWWVVAVALGMPLLLILLALLLRGLAG